MGLGLTVRVITLFKCSLKISKWLLLMPGRLFPWLWLVNLWPEMLLLLTMKRIRKRVVWPGRVFPWLQLVNS